MNTLDERYQHARVAPRHVVHLGYIAVAQAYYLEHTGVLPDPPKALQLEFIGPLAYATGRVTKLIAKHLDHDQTPAQLAELALQDIVHEMRPRRPLR